MTGDPLRPYMLLRHDSHRPKLPEMVIKSESSLHPKPFHHDPADAVCETPALIVIALKDVPCLLDISRQHPDNLGNLLSKQTGSQTEGTSKLAQGPSSQTVLVEVERWTERVPEIAAFDRPVPAQG